MFFEGPPGSPQRPVRRRPEVAPVQRGGSRRLLNSPSPSNHEAGRVMRTLAPGLLSKPSVDPFTRKHVLSSLLSGGASLGILVYGVE
eukprot:4124917-Pyramimonas_sp.AAC.1